jgi:zinc transporter 1/2/3
VSRAAGGRLRRLAALPSPAASLCLTAPTLTHLLPHRLGTFFGFGTILATAFIHMLTPAQYKLSSPCLSTSWLETYEAWAALFCVLSIVVMQALDFVIEGAYKAMLARRRRASPRSIAGATIHSSHAVLDLAATQTGASSRTDGKGYIVTKGDEETGDANCEGSGCVEPGQLLVAAAAGDEHELGTSGACAEHGVGCKHLLVDAARRDSDPSQVVGIYLMEAGIVFHSVVIGITLGVAAGDSFTTLFIALCMHQVHAVRGGACAVCSASWSQHAREGQPLP